jgi:serine/threonine protein phosphatase 1
MFAWLKPKSGRRAAFPPMPAGRTVYVIGDVHGRSDLLARCHRAIDRDMNGRRGETVEICLGDYVDRGPDSAGVIERVSWRRRRHSVVALRGNHEVMFETFLAGGLDPNDWRRAGGLETLLSYGIDVQALTGAPREAWVATARAAVPGAHRDFLASLADAHVEGAYFFTHAGIRPGVPLAAQDPSDLQWIRDGFIDDPRDHGAIVVHGHTPVREPEFLANRINLDTGAYLTNRLTCMVIDEEGPGLLPIGAN